MSQGSETNGQSLEEKKILKRERMKNDLQDIIENLLAKQRESILASQTEIIDTLINKHFDERNVPKEETIEESKASIPASSADRNVIKEPVNTVNSEMN